MSRWKAVLKKLLRPGGGWAASAALLGGGSLALTFFVFGEDSPFAYVSYLLSAYGLVVLVAETSLYRSREKLRKYLEREEVAL